MAEIMLLSKSGVIHLLAISAYRKFEKTPRRRATAAMNLLFSKAKGRGYGAAENLKTYFRNPNVDRDQERLFVGELAELIDVDDIQMALSYVAAV